MRPSISAFTTQGQRPLAALHYEHESLDAEGRLGWVQPVGRQPAPATAMDTAEYGVGALLLAAEQMAELAEMIHEGAMVFLRREYTLLVMFIIVLRDGLHRTDFGTLPTLVA